MSVTAVATAPKGAVVVGVDGSSNSRSALMWAADEARRRNVPCFIVHAWEYPATVMASPYVLARSLDVFRTDGERVVADALAMLEGLGLQTSGHLVRGPAGPALVEAAAEAGVLVVGTKGHGAIMSTLLGSVSEFCVHHASCPVVVVPPPEVAASAPETKAAAGV
jgi:nucleotide-binding universal stress UspA family protein